MNALRAMYGLRRVCLAVTSFLMSACTIHLLNLPSELPAAHLCQGLQDFQSMSVNHQFAARCIDIISSLASKWNISLPENTATVSGSRGSDSRGWRSPPSSAFFAASIPRKQSSGNSARSESAITRLQDGPFDPPQPIQHQQQYESFFSDPSTPMEPTQNQNVFWTPFPVQGIPTLQQGWSNTMSGISAQAVDSCLLYTSPSPRDGLLSRMPSSA